MIKKILGLKVSIAVISFSDKFFYEFSCWIIKETRNMRCLAALCYLPAALVVLVAATDNEQFSPKHTRVTRDVDSSSTDIMARNLLEWIQGIYRQGIRKTRQDGNGYLPPYNDQRPLERPRPFQPAPSPSPSPPFPSQSPSLNEVTSYPGLQPSPGIGSGFSNPPPLSYGSTPRPTYIPTSTRQPSSPGYSPSSFPTSPARPFTGSSGFPGSSTTFQPPSPTYGYPSSSGGYPSSGYPSSPSPTPGFPTPSPGYPSPSPGYPSPSPGYPSPSPGYPSPSPGYPSPSPGYPSPSPGYPSPSPGTPTDSYGYPSPSPSPYPSFPTPGTGPTGPGYPTGPTGPGSSPTGPGSTPGGTPTPGRPSPTPGRPSPTPGRPSPTPGRPSPGPSPTPGSPSPTPGGGDKDTAGGSPGDNNVSPPGDDDDLKHPPHIHELQVQCSKTMMTIDIEFNRQFDGVIYSKGFYMMPECRYVAENSGQTKYSFTVNLDSCGTEFINDFEGEAGQAYLENVLVLQNELGIQEVWDTVRRVRCLWEGNINKALTVSLSVDMLNQEIVTFSGDTATAKLDIQVGKGPFAPAATGLVKIGEPMTLVVSVEGDPGFDLQVRDCIARDEPSLNIVQLTDERGCILKPKLFGAFQKTRETGNTGASIIAYAFFQAFKFPDVMDLFIECNVELCKTNCEACPDENQQIEPGRRRRDVSYAPTNSSGALSDPIRMGRGFRVIMPDDLSLASSQSLENLENTAINEISLTRSVCMSYSGFYGSFSVMVGILVASTMSTIILYTKTQRIAREKSYDLPQGLNHH
ncbi:uncharacterized protein LOC123267715 isoform X1 [Cotesia glomerata]|nr:uncharacterized protein LOC123267715 isoform X1 [Cotesia glomerata]